MCFFWGGDPLISAVNNAYYYPDEGIAKVQGLSETLNGNHNTTYSRYWHGYVIVLKPLLVLFNVQEIRLIFQTILLVLLGVVAAIAANRMQRYGLVLSVLFVVSCGLFGVMEAASDLPMFFSFFVMCLTTLAVLLIDRMRLIKAVPVLMFLSGALTVYFDFLDNPIVSLGVPLVFLVFRLGDNHFRFSRIASAVCLSCLFWALGYGCLWVFKWLIAAFVSGPDSFLNTMHQILFRVGVNESEQGVETSPQLALSLSFQRLGFLKYIMMFEITIFMLLSIWIACSHKCSLKRKRYLLSVALLLSGVFLVPIVWIVVLSNHTAIHVFTYRDLIVGMFSFSAAILWLIQGILSTTHDEKTILQGKTSFEA